MNELRNKIARLSPKQRALLELRLKRRKQGEKKKPAIQRAPRDGGPYPLSFAQSRLWTIHQLDPQSAAYHLHGAFRVPGELRLSALARSLDEIVRRHEALRTHFVVGTDGPAQHVAPRLSSGLRVIDLSALSSERRAALTRRLAFEQASRPFDLERGPLFRFRILRRGETDHVFSITLHHIVADGWSLQILAREVMTLYVAFAAGRPSTLAELPCQYIDFSEWQREWLQGRVLERELGFWKQRLEGAPEVLNLPLDRQRPAVQTSNGARVSRRLGGALSRKLRQLGPGTTLFMRLLAAFQALLHRVAGQTKIPVGTPIAGRDQVEIEDLIGFFAGTLVLVADVADDPSFAEVLKQVRKNVLDAHAHQHLPFEKLVEELQPQRNLSYSPLFQVGFALHNDAPRQAGQGSTRGLEPLPIESTAVKFDLMLEIHATEGQLSAVFAYNTDLFDPSTLERLGDQFKTLLESAVSDPDARLSDLALLGAAQRHALRLEWNDHAGDRAESTIPRLFEEQVARSGDCVAAAFEDVHLSYRHMNRRADRWAEQLVRLGVGPEVTVGVFLERSAELPMAFLAVLKAGGVYLPLDPTHPEERLVYMLEDSGVRVFLTQKRLAPSLPADRGRVVEIDSGLPPRHDPSAPGLPVIRPQNAAYIIYTSGSTGWPKGAQISHRGLCNLVAAQHRSFGLASGDKVLQFSSLNFDASIFEFMLALLAGATLQLFPRAALLGAGFSHRLRRRPITATVLTPSALTAVPPDEQLPQLRTLIVAGEACSPELARRWATNRRFFNAYGPTETTIWASVCDWRPAMSDPPIGRPVKNARLYLLGRRLEVAPVAISGELHIGGVALGRGYLNRPGLTAQKFIADPFSDRPGERLYKTGDLSRFRTDGQIDFQGRIDHQVKIRGFRIEMGEIERTLERQPAVHRAVVIKREFSPGDHRLVAYVVAAEPGATSASELRGALAKALPDYMVPAAFVFIDALPLTPTGKLDQKALPAPDGTADDQRPAVAPRDHIEVKLVRIWAQLLGIGQFGITDDFFELGGHSLLAVRLMEEIRQEFGEQPPLSLLFQAGTIESLAEALRQSSDGALGSPMVPLQDGQQPPLVLVHPGSGQVLCYRDLANSLGNERATYALEDPGLHGGWDFSIPIPEMAAHYVEALRAVQPDGPYLLGGMSFGGTVAFEMAKQLREQDTEVAMVALLDAGEPTQISRRLSAQSDAQLLTTLAREGGLEVSTDELENQEPEERYEFLLEMMKQAGIRFPGMGVPWIRNTLELFKTRIQVSSHYDPGTYGGRLTMFRATGEELGTRDFEDPESGAVADPVLGWQSHSLEPVEVEFAPGNHATLCIQPNVRILAERLNHRIETALGELSAGPGSESTTFHGNSTTTG